MWAGIQEPHEFYDAHSNVTLCKSIGRFADNHESMYFLCINFQQQSAGSRTRAEISAVQPVHFEPLSGGTTLRSKVGRVPALRSELRGS